MKVMKKHKQHRPPRYEVTARIEGIGVRKHVMILPEHETTPRREEAITKRFIRVYPNRDVSILRIVERR